jgi:hypothetical protein
MIHLKPKGPVGAGQLPSCQTRTSTGTVQSRCQTQLSGAGRRLPPLQLLLQCSTWLIPSICHPGGNSRTTPCELRTEAGAAAGAVVNDSSRWLWQSCH